MSINYFLRNGARNSLNRTFGRRQWAQYLLFLFFTQHLFQSIWSLLFDVNQLFSQKWSPKLSKAKFCSKTVSTIFAAFFFSSQHLKKIVVPASLMEQLNVGFLLTNTSKPAVGWVILSCKRQVFSIISEFDHHFQEISLFVKSTILGKSIFGGLDGVEMWWGKKFIY